MTTEHVSQESLPQDEFRTITSGMRSPPPPPIYRRIITLDRARTRLPLCTVLQ